MAQHNSDMPSQTRGVKGMVTAIIIIVGGIVTAGVFLVLWSCLWMAKRQDEDA